MYSRCSANIRLGYRSVIRGGKAGKQVAFSKENVRETQTARERENLCLKRKAPES